MFLLPVIITAIVGFVIWKSVLPMLKNANSMMQNANQMMQGVAAQNQLAQTGTPAQGKVIHIQDTGTSVNMNPLVRFTVEVLGAKSYQVMFESMVPMIALARVQPGSIVPLRIDPMNPARATLGAL